MKKMTLSKVAIALSACYATQFAYADIQSATNQTQISRQNGVEIINIANPSSSGLSHNKYTKFNVDKSGAVLNNAVQNSQSQLAGQVAKNPNLKRSATVILNEVVSANPSRIAGKQEIVGKSADYVLANPHGISVENAGFINTSRETLVTGQPVVNRGNLTGYRVNGEKSLTVKGDLTGSNIDLIAPTVSVTSNIKAEKGNVNIIAGRNEIQRDADGKLTINVLNNTGKVLDGKIAGSIQANRIRIHSTDDRANLAVDTQKLQAKEIVLSAGSAKINGKLQDKETKFNDQAVAGGNNLTTNENQGFTKSSIKADTLVIGVKNQLELTGVDIDAKNATIVGGNTHLGSVKTTSQNTEIRNRTQGKGKSTERDVSRKETVHGTTIKADTLKVAATTGKLTGSAVKLDGKNIALHGETGTELKGVITTAVEEKHATSTNPKNPRLSKISYQSDRKQSYDATEINATEHLVITGGETKLTGVKANVGGDAVIKNRGQLQLNAEMTANVLDKKEYETLNGKIRGKKIDSSESVVKQNGSDFNVKGTTFIDAEKGVLLSGSRVLSGKDGLVKANEGGITLKSKYNAESFIEQKRQNNVRVDKFGSQSTAQTSSIQSDSNLQLTTTKDINVVGGSIIASGLLDMATLGNINIRSDKNMVAEGSSYFGPSFSAKVEKPQISLDKNQLISSTIDVAADLITGNTKPNDVPKQVVGNIKDSVKFKVEASATAGHLNKFDEHSEINRVGANISGSSTALTSNQSVNVAASNVTATEGDLDITAKQVNVLAENDRQRDHNFKTAVGFTNTITVTESAVTHKALLGVQHNTHTEVAETAKGTTLSAKNDVNVNAGHITHQGSTVNAGGNVAQNADVVTNLASHNVTETADRYIDAGISATSTFSKGGYNGKFALEIAGGRDLTTETTANPTTVNAGGNIVTNANSITDVGTQYKAEKDVNLTSKQHNIISAQDTHRNEQMNAGASLGVTVSTPNYATATVGVNLGVNYQKDNTQSAQAKPASVQGENVNIQTGKLTSQADITANQNVNINAQNATLTQSQNVSAHKGGGFGLNLGVGAIAVPGAGAVPSVDFGVSVNTHKGQKVDAVVHNVQGNNVAINGTNGLALQGTNVVANENVDLTGKYVSVSPAVSTNKDKKVNVDLGFSLGADVSSLGINANVNVNAENSKVQPSVAVNGQNVNIVANNGVTLTGVTSNSQNLNVDAGKGSLNLNAAQNNVNKVNVDAGFSLNGGLADSKWTPDSGSASLSVDVTKNQTHTSTNLTTENAKLSGNGGNFVGSGVSASNVENNLGKVNKVSLTDKINEVHVSASADGSGTFTPYPAESWKDSLKEDWNNGTIAGVTSDVAFKVDSKRQETVKPAGINPPAPTVTKDQVVKAEVNFSTNLKDKLMSFLKSKLMTQN